MTVDYSKLRSVTARQLVSALQADGFQYVNCSRQTGIEKPQRHIPPKPVLNRSSDSKAMNHHF
jgi:hypothetical protein